MKTAKKPFDAVSMMREIRDKARRREVDGMSFDKEKRFIRNKVRRPSGRRSTTGPSKVLPAGQTRTTVI